MSGRRRSFNRLIPWAMFLSLGALGSGAFAAPGNPAQPASRVYVHSLDEFHRHCQLHISRVGKLGQVLLQKFRYDFTGISPALLKEYLAIHDITKIVNPEISAELYNRFYSRTNLSKSEGVARDAVVARLNQQDDAARMAFFRKHGLINREGQLSLVALDLKQIENIADLVDRYKSPISEEEFGRAMKSARGFVKNTREAQMTDFLEMSSVYYRTVAVDDFDLSGVGCTARRFRGWFR